MTNSQTNATYEAGFDAGIAAERNRIVGILQSDEGKARPAAALDLAITPGGITSETARKLLSRMPVEGAPVAGGASFSHGRGSRPGGRSGVSAEVDRIVAEMGAGQDVRSDGASPPPQKSGLIAAVDQIAAEEFRRAGR